jgi:hypothetical protein
MRANKEYLAAVRVTGAEMDALKAIAELNDERVSDLLRRIVQREIKKAARGNVSPRA